MAIEILNVSTKGQIVLPAKMRKKMAIQNGDKLIAYQSGNSILLKPLELPSENDFSLMLKQASDWAKKVDLKEEDINTFIKDYRSKSKDK